MKLSIPLDSILGLVFALGGAAIFAYALTLKAMAGMNVGPGLFPGIVGAGMTLMGLALVVQGWLARNVPEEGEAQPLLTWFAVGIVAAIVVAIVAMPYLGFLVTGTLFSIIIVLVSGGGFMPALIFSPIATGTIYAIFNYAMRVSLPHGLLG